MKNKIKFLFLTPVQLDARIGKRIQKITEYNVSFKIASFKRCYYKGIEYENGIIVLGKIENRKYIKRLYKIIKASKIIYKILKENKINTVYCFSFDFLLISVILKKIFSLNYLVVYEVADIREVFLRETIISSIFRIIDRILILNTDLIVATSYRYISEYYKKMLRIKKLKYIIIENKIDYDSMKNKQKNNILIKSSKLLKIGYFGLFRDENSWAVLKKITSNLNNVEVHLWGFPFGIKTFEQDITEFDNIIYHGEYLSPRDLGKIYSSVDIVWACYPRYNNNVNNWQWAMTNRFYESCYFRKPMIVDINSLQCQLVTKYGIGYCVDIFDINSILKLISNINKAELHRFKINFRQLPTSVYLHSDEHLSLIKTIMTML